MRYVGRRVSETNPLRSIPLFRPASTLRRAEPRDWPDLATAAIDSDFQPAHHPEPTAQQRAERVLANAEAALLEALSCHAAARAGIGEANRTTLPDTLPAFIRRQAGPFVPVRLTAERVRQRKSQAFRLFNQRRRELARARHAVDAARASLGLPSLAAVAERHETAAAVRASKRCPVNAQPMLFGPGVEA